MDKTVTRGRPTGVPGPCAGPPGAVAAGPVAVRRAGGAGLCPEADRIAAASRRSITSCCLATCIRAPCQPLVASFADRQVATNIRPGARRAIARDKAQGRRLVLATASYRLYADAIAERLGFDDVIGTGSVIGLDDRVHAGSKATIATAGEAADDLPTGWKSQASRGSRPRPLLFRPCSDQPAFEWADERSP